MHKGLGKHAFQGLISCSIFRGIGVGYWFCVSFFFFLFSGRIFSGVIAVEEIWWLFVFVPLILFSSFMDFFKILFSFDSKFEIANQLHALVPYEFKKKKKENEESKWTTNTQEKKKKILEKFNAERYAISRNAEASSPS